MPYMLSNILTDFMRNGEIKMNTTQQILLTSIYQFSLIALLAPMLYWYVNNTLNNFFNSIGW